MRAFVTSLTFMLLTSACVSTKDAPPLGASVSTALTRCILLEAQRIAPKAIKLDAAAHAVIAACKFQLQEQRSALLAKSQDYGPEVRGELAKLEADHLELAKEQIALSRSR